MQNNIIITKNTQQIAEFLNLTKKDIKDRFELNDAPGHNSQGKGILSPELLLERSDVFGDQVVEKLLIGGLFHEWVLSFKYFPDSRILIYESNYKPNFDAEKNPQKQRTWEEAFYGQNWILSQNGPICMIKPAAIHYEEMNQLFNGN